MKRREFINGLIGATVLSMSAQAQNAPPPIVGYLYGGSPEATEHLTIAFRKGLGELGFEEGRNLTIEYRWARNQLDRLPELAADLVRRHVDAIATPFTLAAALAAKRATSTIPIVFSTGADPVQIGLVESLARPGGNATGFSYMSMELAAKRLGVLLEVIPNANRIAMLANPTSPNYGGLIKDIQSAGRAKHLRLEIYDARTNLEIDEAFQLIVRSSVGGLLVSPDTLFTNRRVQLSTLAARNALPTIYPFRDHAEAGGLMSYGASIPDEFRQVGAYVGRILKGARPADLPVTLPTKFEFVINMETAKALGLTIPETLLATADEVIQ